MEIVEDEDIPETDIIEDIQTEEPTVIEEEAIGDEIEEMDFVEEEDILLPDNIEDIESDEPITIEEETAGEDIEFEESITIEEGTAGDEIDEIEHIEEEEDILEPEIIDDAESQESITVEEAIASNDIEKDEMIVQEGPQIENESAPNEAISLKPEHDALEQEFSQLEKENLEYRQELETYYKDLSNHAQEMKDKGLYDRYEETRDEMNRVSARLDELTKERLANSKEYYAEIHDIDNKIPLVTSEIESYEASMENVVSEEPITIEEETTDNEIEETELVEEDTIPFPDNIEDIESEETITVEAIAANDIENDETTVQEEPGTENESAAYKAVSSKPEHDVQEQESSQLEKENLEYRQDLETYYQDLSDHAQEMKDKGLYDRYEETRDEMDQVSARLDELTNERSANSKESNAEVYDIKNNGSLETTEKESNEAINEAVSEITNSSPQQINTLPIDTNAQGDDITTFERPMDFGRFAHEAYELAAYNAFDDIEKEYPVIVMDQDGNEQNGKIDTLIVENDKNFIIDYKTNYMKDWSISEAKTKANEFGKQVQGYVEAKGVPSDCKGYIISTVPPESKEVRDEIERVLANYNIGIVFSESEDPEDVVDSIRKAIKKQNDG